MKMALRCVGGIAAGLVVSFVLVVAVELLSAVVHPVPEGFGGSPDEVRTHVERYPGWVLALVVLAWGATAFAGVWTAGRVGNRACGAFVGLLLLSAVILNVSMLPYPLWFKVGVLIAVPVAGVGAYLVSSPRARATGQDFARER